MAATSDSCPQVSAVLESFTDQLLQTSNDKNYPVVVGLVGGQAPLRDYEGGVVDLVEIFRKQVGLCMLALIIIAYSYFRQNLLCKITLTLL